MQFDVQYRAELNKLKLPWLEICSDADSPTQVENDMIAKQDQSDKPLPFLNADHHAIHKFWKANVRPSETSVEPELFTNFTFILVDKDCLEADPPCCNVCCDAPDYGYPLDYYDDDPILTVLRFSLEYLPNHIIALEQLMLTVSDLVTRAEYVLCSMPPFTEKVKTPGARDRVCVMVSAKEARAAKHRGLILQPEPNYPAPPAYDHDREAVLFLCSKSEALRVGQMNSYSERTGRIPGMPVEIHHIDNRERQPKAPGPLEETSGNAARGGSSHPTPSEGNEGNEGEY